MTRTNPSRKSTRPIIVGFGPAGIFAALELVDAGVKPIIFERGKRVEDRLKDINLFISKRVLNEESNVQFGEGGAGTYSDGKLFSRANNSVLVNKVLATFIKFGAPENIATISKPHLGTDVLCAIIKKMRAYILERGGEINFGSKMTGLIIKNGKCEGVIINNDREYLSPAIFLGLGHSARDTFEVLHNSGVAIEAKPISVGVRIEHPAKTINRMRYGAEYWQDNKMPAAFYSFTHTNRTMKRGAYSFCMCPGGEIVNASSSHGELALNGMSYSQRASDFSNSAIVVTCHTSDYPSNSPLAGIEFQKEMERRAFASTGGTWMAPAQNLPDFLAERISENPAVNSYKMGVAPVNLKTILPDFVSGLLVEAFLAWREKYPFFVSHEALLLGVETRTTCPLRITRNEQGESVNVRGLFPIGEGAGYAGGITSSSADGLKAARAFLSRYSI